MSKKNRQSGGNTNNNVSASQTNLNPQKVKKGAKTSVEMQYKYLRNLEILSYIILMILALVALELPQPFGQIVQISVLFFLVIAEMLIRSKKKKLLESMEKDASREKETQSQPQ